MVEAIFISIIIIIILAFITSSKKITALESVFIYMTTGFINTTIFDILATNIEAIDLSKKLIQVIITRIATITVFPIIMIFYIELINSTKSRSIKIGSFIISSILLILSEQFLNTFGFIKYITWSLEKSALFWTIYLLILPFLVEKFRYTIKKESHS